MNKTIVGVIASVVAIIVITAVLLAVTNNDGNPVTSTTENGMQTEMSGENKQSNLDTSSDMSKETSGEAVQTNTIDIKDYAYMPANTKVKKGTSVTWTNQDTAKHDVTPDTATDAFKASNLLAKGESYTVTFDTPGTYSYFCSPHPYMKATIEVTE